jgi:tRNA(His) guanylyltransferase
MKDDLGNRMKAFYEDRSRVSLLRRVPVIVRVDGKSFHTFCKRFERPYDVGFHTIMNNVMKYLCENIQGVKFAQRHSDEISLLITDYDTLTTDAFFDYNIQKVCSIVSGLATSELCKQLYLSDILEKDEKWPIFDCRCFNIPENDISNYFLWRVLDAKRNSINMVAQSKFSHKELQSKTCDDMQEMLFQKFGINWAKLPEGQKNGFICTKLTVDKMVVEGPKKGQVFSRKEWTISPLETGSSPSKILSKLIEYVLVKESPVLD